MSERKKGRGPWLRLGGIVGLALLGAMLSAALLRHHANPGEGWAWAQAMCGGEAGESGCDVVNRSPAASLLGLPLALWGFVYYGALLVLALVSFVASRPLQALTLTGLAAVGFCVDVGLLAYSLFALRALCGLCVATYGVTFAILLLSLSLLRGHAAAGEVTPRAPMSAKAHALLLSFGVLSVVAAGGFLFEHWSAPSRTRARLFEDPDEALRVAWSVFHHSYEQTEPVAIPGEDLPMKGSTRAVLNLTLFADFLCRHCRRSAKLLGDFVDAHRDTVALEFRSYPLDDACNSRSDGLHVGSCLLSKGALAAGEQGHFWYFHDLLFANSELWRAGVQPAQLVHLAEQAGLDAKAFERALGSEAVSARVVADIEAAHAVGVEGTPTLFINGRRMASIPIRTFLEELLRQEAGQQQPFYDLRAMSRRATE